MSGDGNGAEEALSSGERELRLLVETIPALVWRANPEGNVEYVNKRVLDYFGAPLGEIVGWGWAERVHPDDVAFKVRNWLRNLETESPHDVVCRFRGADNRYRWFNVRGAPLRAGDGRVLRWYGVLIDIDDQTKAEEAFRESEYKLRQIFETVPSQLWSTDPTGEPTQLNKRLLDYSGMRLEDFKRGGWEALMHPDDLPENARTLQNALQTGTSYEAVNRLRRADGEFRWHQTRGEPLRDRQGRIVQWYGVSVDIDEAKKAEDRLRRSEAYLAEAQWLSRTGSSAFNDTTILYWSDETYRIFGLDPRNGLPSRETALQMIHPDDRERVREEARQAVLQKRDYKLEYRIVLSAGIIKYIEATAHPKFSASGELVEVVSTILDVTERKRAEEALRESEYRLRQIFETVPGLLWSTDPAGEPTQLNQRMLDYTGMRFEDFKHRGWEAFLDPADFPETAKAFDHAIRTGTSYQSVHRLRRADGEFRWHHTRGEPLRDRRGHVVQWYGLSVDIDEAKKAEDELRRSEARLAEAQRLSHTGSAVYNETEILYWSEEASRIWGFDPLQGIPSREAVWKGIHPDDLGRVNQNIEHGVREKRSFANEFRVILPDGTVKHVEATNHPLFSASGELLEIVSTGMDVTERKRAEEALLESQARFRDYAESASDWFWEIGPDYKFTLLTENAFGSDAVDRIGTACWAHVLDLETEPEKWRLMQATLDARKPFRDFVYCSARRDGSPMHVKASGKPVFGANGEFRGYRGTGTDVTALVRAQEEHERLRQLESDLAHMNRLSVMGELAASLAHEITQPIAAARNNARAAMHFQDRNPPDLDEIREALASIVDNADRAGDILDRIRDHIKKAPPRKSRFDLNTAIDEVIGLARSAITANGVSVRTRLAKALVPVEGDRVQLQQVVLNLILNAVEAMGTVAAGRRELSISTEQTETGGVLVSVHDSGPGIDPDHFDRVFQAFYTTKSSGVGMGLAISRSIIDGHGGRLWADASASGGAVFQFCLPGAGKELTNSRRSSHRLH